ncbi:site-specific DNA-methyltransferase [Limnohabitans sp. 103DPR2]|uniref:site-specific DNA-methyltransferase n=1 Tax=Limnohabitans sp. 103DPR2 TaxID=1678129 RepID=UPI0006DD1923|nr:site-specific DNA-methyltransferase [Limnohabitans sp. 103DPR2]ALK91339.1 Modification methylase DpnIIB [Limnohabitans sp. 103DPR2]
MSLLEKLPKIFERSRKIAEQILEESEGKQKISLLTREIVNPSRDVSINDLFSRLKSTDTNTVTNRLIYGDNLLAMSALLTGNDFNESIRGKLDLIYIDPPFDSKTDYRTRVKLPDCEIEQKPTVIEQYAYGDTWSEGTSSYLEMLIPRLFLMKEMLSNKGILAVHIGPSVSHYVKIILDEIFGKDRMLNEVIWQRRLGQSNADRKKMGVVVDSIFIYSMSEDYTFNPQYSFENGEAYVKERYTKVNKDGRRYKTDNLGNPAPRPNLRYEYKGCKPPPNGWAVSLETMMRMDAEDRLEFPAKPGGRLMRRQYLDEWKGKPIQSLWDDLPPINSQAVERIGFDTQKPERLIERIMNFFTVEGDYVADFFGGSGTTAAVAERMKRRWLITDLGKPACMVMRKRLIDMNAQPFIYQAIGDYQVETVKSTLGKRFGMGELAKIVLDLYGAIPLPVDNNPNKDRGYIGKTLVICDSPNKITGLPTLKKAQALRDQLMGGWDKVIVLGWNFASDIGHSVSQLQDSKIEVLVIPPDLMDRLRKRGSFEKLKNTIRFSSLQYLTAKQPVVTKGEEDLIEVELENYVLLSPEAINLDEDNRKKLQSIVNNDPLSLIEYWAIDVNYDGEIFRSVWQDYRGNTDKDRDDLHVVRKAVIKTDPLIGLRRICVRAVDVFGFESEVDFEV